MFQRLFILHLVLVLVKDKHKTSGNMLSISATFKTNNHNGPFHKQSVTPWYSHAKTQLISPTLFFGPIENGELLIDEPGIAFTFLNNTLYQHHVLDMPIMYECA